jgi:hypothetical protein
MLFRSVLEQTVVQFRTQKLRNGQVAMLRLSPIQGEIFEFDVFAFALTWQSTCLQTTKK